MREAYIEQVFIRKVKKRGGLPLKFVSPGWSGAPDRIVILPGKRVVFVELKAPGRRMHPLQKKRAEELERYGFRVYCLDSIESIDCFIREVFGE